MEEAFGYFIAGFVGALVGRIIYKIDKHFTKKEIPSQSMSISIYEMNYGIRNTRLIFYAPLNSPAAYLEPPEWICKKDAAYKFIIG